MWFEGTGDEPFVALMREKFADAPPAGIRAEDTSFGRWPSGPVLEIEIAGLAVPTRLHVGYFPTAPVPRLECEWSFTDYMLDGGRWKTPSPVARGDVEADAAEAFGWVIHQLARPMLELRWTGIFDLNAREIHLDAPQELAHRSGLSLRRLFRRPPDSTTRLR